MLGKPRTVGQDRLGIDFSEQIMSENTDSDEYGVVIERYVKL
jgi:hypothetical protein